MAILLANNASSRLASSINTSVTSLSVTSGHGALFPSPSGGDYFPLTLIQDSGLLEIMKCTARSGDVLTVTRAQEGSTARSFTAGERVELRFTAAVIAAINAELAAMNTEIDGATQGPASAVTDDVALFNGTTGKLLKDSGYKVADFYRKANIVGTVSQSSGVPTGAIIESGSNANGHYIKFADGKMICNGIASSALTTSTTAGSVFVSPTTPTLTFPATFIDIPHVVDGTVAMHTDGTPAGGTRGWGAVGGSTTTTCTVLVYGHASGSKSFPGYIAYGRWF